MIMTPYWSLKSSTNKNVSLDQIVIADTGGIDSETKIKAGINQFLDINKNLNNSTKSRLKSVCKRLDFKSQNYNQEYYQAIEEDIKEETSM
mmetsp:Transcript_6785/g.5933  ORF Transcript_6785/g.5933 Transcript_6785/m.5933 type:complete len:91 (-) Transcript_6785:212-484(-)